jgi:hypothetical protein
MDVEYAILRHRQGKLSIIFALANPPPWHSIGVMVDIRPYLPCTVRQLQVKLEIQSYSQFHAAVSGKRPIQPMLAIRISNATGISKSLIRPDLWPPRKSRQSDPAA